MREKRLKGFYINEKINLNLFHKQSLYIKLKSALPILIYQISQKPAFSEAKTIR